MSQPQARNITLDALRGIAILLVVVSHTIRPAFVFKSGGWEQVARYVKPFIVFFGQGGWIGVDLFFVLSGFLISGLLFKEYKQTQGVNAGRFLIRRAFKIYPVFYAFLIFTLWFEWVTTILNTPVLQPVYNNGNYWPDFLFLANYLDGRWLHGWSLDVEEHFYLLFIVFFLWLIKTKNVSFVVFRNAYIFLVAFTIAARIFNFCYPQNINQFIPHYAQTHIRIDNLFCGVLIGYCYHQLPQKLNFILVNQKLFIVLCLTYLLSNFLFNQYSNYFMPIVSLSVNSMCFGALLVIALHQNYAWLQSKRLAWVGRMSYGIYVWHALSNPLLNYFIPTLNTNRAAWLFYLPVYFILSIGLGWAATRFIELPLLNVRDRYFPSSTRGNIITAKSTSQSTY